MKLSTKGRYGVKAMVELAIHYGDSPLSIKTISQTVSSNGWQTVDFGENIPVTPGKILCSYYNNQRSSYCLWFFNVCGFCSIYELGK